jgi:cytochrome bd-type quinol oxidase subunit 1
MGLALLIVVLKGMRLRAGPGLAARANEAARLGIRVVALGFVMGVVTVIPREFLFGRGGRSARSVCRWWRAWCS